MTLRARKPRSDGFALIEVLFALALLGLGLSALLSWLQPHVHTQRQQLAREAAMRLADNLAQRMHLNATQATAYAQSWGSNSAEAKRTEASFAPVVDCQQQRCTPTQLAVWDGSKWRTEVRGELAEGDASVFASDDGWWGIVVAWHDAREQLQTDASHGTPPCPPKHSCWRLWVRP
jgi:type IV pilus modification protein PilV